jgi:DhnA family fructose-bisphosphate aldolase class Ia
MTGHWLRLNRLFAHGKRAVIVAVDHGLFFGPTPGLEDLPATAEAVSEADALLLSPAMIAHCGAVFSVRGAPLAIARLNWSTVYCEQWDYHQARMGTLVEPAEALAMGADLALASLNLTENDEAQDAQSVERFARLVAAKQQCGLPLIGEFYPPRPGRLTLDELHERVSAGCRILAELGADAIKTFYTGERFGEVCQSVGVPVLALGAEKLAREVDALSLAHSAVQAGARGVVFGRNVFQAANSSVFLQALKRVVKDDVPPVEAAAEQELL